MLTVPAARVHGMLENDGTARSDCAAGPHRLQRRPKVACTNTPTTGPRSDGGHGLRGREADEGRAKSCKDSKQNTSTRASDSREHGHTPHAPRSPHRQMPSSGRCPRIHKLRLISRRGPATSRGHRRHPPIATGEMCPQGRGDESRPLSRRAVTPPRRATAMAPCRPTRAR